ncbi:MAG TPA: hypothetical protein VK935_10595, partial [Actinomycetospora sp.]|nr:hypothetical protein [Actinomycetospora sp.]
MPDRSFHVVALSFPIVYNRDGDHDPNGMLYTHARYVPLLDFAREQWERDDEYLPRAHRRDQLITMLLDGLERYEAMDEALRTTLVEHAHLLAYRGRPGGGSEEEGPDLDVPPAHREIAQHYRLAVDELATVLDELTDGDLREVDPDKAVREEWRAVWQAGQVGLRDAIDKQLVLINMDVQAARPWLNQIVGPGTIRRLLLNDHSNVAAALAAGVNGYDRFNPMKPLAFVRPLVLRARAGETVRVTLENQTRRPHVGLHRQGAGLAGTTVQGVRGGDGAHVGANPPSTATRTNPVTYVWDATTEGVWPVNDLADVRGTEAGTNAHGLFGAFVV